MVSLLLVAIWWCCCFFSVLNVVCDVMDTWRAFSSPHYTIDHQPTDSHRKSHKFSYLGVFIRTPLLIRFRVFLYNLILCSEFDYGRWVWVWLFGETLLFWNLFYLENRFFVDFVYYSDESQRIFRSANLFFLCSNKQKKKQRKRNLFGLVRFNGNYWRKEWNEWHSWKTSCLLLNRMERESNDWYDMSDGILLHFLDCLLVYDGDSRDGLILINMDFS